MSHHPPRETLAETLNNNYYRHVVEMTEQYAFVLMSIPYGGSIPMEKHSRATQFTRVEHGTCSVIRDGIKEKVPEDGHFFVPPGVYHEVINDDEERKTLKLYNVYIPPPENHDEGDQFYEGLIQRSQKNPLSF